MPLLFPVRVLTRPFPAKKILLHLTVFRSFTCFSWDIHRLLLAASGGSSENKFSDKLL